jgi:hypothetical protein
MKGVALILFAAGAYVAVGEVTTVNPLSKVIDLLTSLEAKIVKDGEEEAKAYKEYEEWCDDAAKNTAFEIETAKTNKAKLEATIGKCSSDIEALTSKIEGLAASINSDESDLKKATLIREKEHADFLAAEKELMETVDTLDRAIGILEREMAKNPALMQVDSTSFKTLLQSLSTVIDAAALPGSDKKKLVALVQSQSESQSLDMDEQQADAEETLMTAGAPDPVAYKTHSTSIVDVLEDLKDKADAELSDLRKAETNGAHSYDMLKNSLEASIANGEKSLEEEKAAKGAAEEKKATAEGDLATTVKDLADAEAALAAIQASCMQVAADHEVTLKGRAEELAVLAKAKEILGETTAGAVEETYSLLQTAAASRAGSRADLAHSGVIVLIKKLARKHHSKALQKLASQVEALMQYGAKFGDDPFKKVKGLITSLIDRLMAEAAAEATEKAYCDEQMARTEEKKSELEADIDKLTAKIDSAAAASAKLKEEVKELQAELAALAKEQAEMDKLRTEQNAAYVDAKKDLELGLSGVGQALDVLRQYYGGAALLQAEQPPVPEKHVPAGGAGGGIIGILEVVESDFAANLAKEETQEADAAAEYEKITQENKVTKALQEQDVKYKTQEFKGLDKLIAELTADKDNLSTELAAVLEYYEKIKDRCIAKAETYEERKRRRDAEIAGLKEALSVLSGEALLQRDARRGAVRL